MVEHRGLVFQYPVVAGIELVDVTQAFISPEQVFECTALEPLPVQPPLTAGRQQPVRYQHEQHLVPARFPCGFSTSAATRIGPTPDVPITSAPASMNPTRAVDTAAVATDAAAPPTRPTRTHRSGLRETAATLRGASSRSSNTSMERRQACACVSLISPRYTHGVAARVHRPRRRFSTTLQYRCVLPSFLRVVERRNMASHYPHAHSKENHQGLHYSAY